MIVEFDLNAALKVKEQTDKEQIKVEALKRAEEINAQCGDVVEFDGYKITAEQCNKINVGEREAVDKFFNENKARILNVAKSYLRRQNIPVYIDRKGEEGRFAPQIIEVYDCINQLYVDMRSGYLIFALIPKTISRLICHSFSYAGVGGFGDEDGVYFRGFSCVNT